MVRLTSVSRPFVIGMLAIQAWRTGADIWIRATGGGLFTCTWTMYQQYSPAGSTIPSVCLIYSSQPRCLACQGGSKDPETA